MTQLIDKAAVVAEIERMMAEEMSFYEQSIKEDCGAESSSPVVYTKLEILLHFLDTLKVVATPKNYPKCTGCYFSEAQRMKHGLSPIKFPCFAHGYACTASIRRDKHHVIFVRQ